MSGKPTEKKPQPAAGSKPSAKASAAPAKSKPEPAAASAGKTAPHKRKEAASGGGKSKPADDDPFAVEKLAASKAVKLSPRPTKDRRWAVKCPMCETMGYAPKAAAGRNLYCANSDCLVPTFPAPEPEPEEPAEPEQQPSSSLPMWIAAAVLLIAIGGGAYWFLFMRGDGTGSPGASGGPSFTNTGGGAGTTAADAGTNGNTGGTDSSNGGAVTPKPPTIKERRKQALEAMVKASQRAQTQRKAYCRRETAEAYALTGDVEEARHQLGQLEIVGKSVTYYAIPPLVEIAFAELRANRANEAGAAVKEASELAGGLPQYGRFPRDAASMLAAALFVTGDTNAARDLVGRHSKDDELGRLSAEISIAREQGRYDFDEFLRRKPMLPLQGPEWTAATVTAAARGRVDEALAWAEANRDDEQRAEAVAAWAETLVILGPDAKRDERIDAAAAKLTPAGRAAVLARVAAQHAWAGDEAAAKQRLQAAKQILDGVKPQPSPRLGDVKQTLEMTLLDASPLRTAALAAGETARVEALLGDADAAWTSLNKAFEFARALGPSRASTQAAVSRLDSRRSDVESELRTKLELDNEDEVGRKVRQYQQKLSLLDSASLARFDLQTTLLARAAQWDGKTNLRNKIREEIVSRTGNANPAEQENYLATEAPWVLLRELVAAGDDENSETLRKALTSAGADMKGWEALQEATAKMAAGDEYRKAAGLLNRFRGNQAQLARWVTRLGCRMVADGRVDEAFQFIGAFSNPVLKEDAFEFAAAQATARGDVETVWKRIAGRVEEMERDDKVAACRGLTAASLNADSPKPSESGDPSEGGSPDSQKPGGG